MTHKLRMLTLQYYKGRLGIRWRGGRSGYCEGAGPIGRGSVYCEGYGRRGGYFKVGEVEGADIVRGMIIGEGGGYCDGNRVDWKRE